MIIRVKSAQLAYTVPIFFVMFVPVRVSWRISVIMKVRVPHVAMTMIFSRVSVDLTPSVIGDPETKAQ